MTGQELQSRIVRAIERQYDAYVARFRAQGMDPAQARAQAMTFALRLLDEALRELRGRGLFPFSEDPRSI